MMAGATPVSKPESLLDLVVPADPQMLSVVRAAVERLTEILGFSEAETRSITRAVDEAVANVIRHAYGGDPNKRIDVSCKRVVDVVNGKQREGLEFQLLDSGHPFDREKLTARSLDEVKPGGLGLHFMRDSMDLMEHSRAEGLNRLRMVKYLDGEPKGSLDQGE
jgi:anti-sigma regulatory factor (Ser/Thr protein kinase)